MPHDIQPWACQVGWYMRNCLNGSRSEPLFGILEDHAEELASRMTDADPDEDDAVLDELEDDAPQTPRAKLSREKRRADLALFLADFAVEPAMEPVTAENIAYAAEEFQLSDMDVSILKLVLRYGATNMLESFCDAVHEELDSVVGAVAALLGSTETLVGERLARDAPLLENGILVLDRSGHGLSGPGGEMHMIPSLSQGMRRPHPDRAAWTASLLGRLLEPTHGWEEYAHIGVNAELARKALMGWTAEGAPGLHIFLVGPTGVGKTEFAKTLAREAGLRAWSVGESEQDSDNPELTRAQRLAAFRLSCAMVRTKRDCVLVMDEAGDVLQAPRSFGHAKGERSKLFLNRIMEHSPVPVIWTGNDTDDMDEASVRRMTQVVEMKVPDRSARTRIWNRVLERQKLELSAGAEARLADRWEAAPAVAANAARIVRLAGGGEREVEVALFGSMTAMGKYPRLPERDGRDFDPELVVCEEDLLEFAGQISAPGAEPTWSACFYGAPGTGKSEYASYLATRLGLPVHRIHASDVFSKWHGETEQNMAKMFAEARSKNAVLIMDEIDALVFDRGQATQSYQVSMVDTMLTHMEQHPLPFMGTTNALSNIDPAALRRFTFAFEFKHLDEARSILAFRRLLGTEPVDVLPTNLAPADFAGVRKQARMRKVSDAHTLTRWLWKASANKGGQKGAMGFRAAPLVATATQAARR